ncbi:MEDS domain-containing protein [Streptomyces hundungensis]|uniref:MEDS domain-containing protein n=1 Tax=Streptomyces hundungensis TaxID=1077946 RepID=UPI000EA8698E|nr:MEDS domain-containing protein [Streptomyces hundungensis]
MRAARALATLDEVELGDHVCWRMDPDAALLGGARGFVADGALYGDKIVVIGGVGEAPDAPRPAMPPTWVVLDFSQAANTSAVLAAVRREARTAVREGFRSVRVLTERAPTVAADRVEDLLEQELKLDQFASESGAIVVCAYRPSQWNEPTLEHMACVHPHEVGTRAERPAFRMFSTGADRWSVDGVIDSEGASAFNAALRAAIAQAPTITLRFDTLDMIDAAGMHALVDAARSMPARRILVEGANETVRLCWELAGYEAADRSVVMGA